MITEITKEEKEFFELQKFTAQHKMINGVEKGNELYWMNMFKIMNNFLERAIVKKSTI